MYCSARCYQEARNVAPEGFGHCHMCKRNVPLAEYGSLSNSRCLECSRKIQYDKIRTIPGKYGSLRRAARFRGIKFELTLEQYIAIVADNKCTYCDGPLDEAGSGLDRINNDDGYNVTNVKPCCGEHNRIRGDDLSFDEMMLLSPLFKQIRQTRELQRMAGR